jgi:hypothetical protein
MSLRVLKVCMVVVAILRECSLYSLSFVSPSNLIWVLYPNLGHLRREVHVLQARVTPPPAKLTDEDIIRLSRYRRETPLPGDDHERPRNARNPHADDSV